MKSKVLDVIYVTGEASPWNEYEIRFSLRSIEKNLSDIGKVFIIGKRPDFLTDVIHIPSKDVFYPGIHPFGNTANSALAACRKKGLSKRFLLLNSDHIVLHPMPVSNVTPKPKAEMSIFDSALWKFNYLINRLNRAVENKFSKNKHTLTFDCLTPIIFHKMKFVDIANQFDHSKMLGYSMNNIFGQFLNPTASQYATQQKIICRQYKLESLREFLAGPQLISFGGIGLNPSLKWWLHENYSFPSRFEKQLISDRIAHLFEWDRNGRTHKNGVWVFEKHFKHSRLLQRFKLRDTPELRTKLNFKLNAVIKKL